MRAGKPLGNSVSVGSVEAPTLGERCFGDLISLSRLFMSKKLTFDYFPFSFTKIHWMLNPELFLRESQLARLFVCALENVSNKKEREIFRGILSEFIEYDRPFFRRLCKSDLELLVWIINSEPGLFMTTSGLADSCDFLMCDFGLMIEHQFAYLYKWNNRWLLEKIFYENPRFVQWFRGYNSALADDYETKLKAQGKYFFAKLRH